MSSPGTGYRYWCLVQVLCTGTVVQVLGTGIDFKSRYRVLVLMSSPGTDYWYWCLVQVLGSGTDIKSRYWLLGIDVKSRYWVLMVTSSWYWCQIQVLTTGTDVQSRYWLLVLMSNPGTDYWVLMSSPGTGLLSQLSVSLSSFFPPGFPGNLLLIIHKWRSKVWWLNWLFRLGPLLHTWCLLPGSVGGTRILFALVSIHHKFVFYPSQLFLNKVYQVNS